ncbi:hypothetical protein RQP46_011233 [Phenoliferia psychrophenolica]
MAAEGLSQSDADKAAEARKIARIKELFAEEQLTPIIPRVYGDIPSTYESITDDWLTATVGKDVPGAIVTSHQLGPKDTGTSNRRRIFLEWNEVGARAGLPKTLFCKGTSDLINRIILSSWGTLTETFFFNHIRPQLKFEAPTAVFAGFDPERYTSIIMLHDLVAEVRFCDAHTYITKDMAKSQLDALASLHGQFYENVESIACLATFYQRTENMIIHHNLKAVIDQGFRQSQEVIPPRLYARADEIWDATMKSIGRNRGNWYQLADGTMGLSDWQCITRAAWQRDLAYVIAAGLTVEDRRMWDKELVEYYLAALARNGGPSPTAEATWLEMKTQLPTALSL